MEKVKPPPPTSDGSDIGDGDDEEEGEIPQPNNDPPPPEAEPEPVGAPPKKRFKVERPVEPSSDEKMERFFEHPRETMELYFGGYNWNKGSAWYGLAR